MIIAMARSGWGWSIIRGRCNNVGNDLIHEKRVDSFLKVVNSFKYQ